MIRDGEVGRVSEQHIREALGHHGLGVERIIYGHQDLLVAGLACEKH
jgi:hypothetical protein